MLPIVLIDPDGTRREDLGRRIRAQWYQVTSMPVLELSNVPKQVAAIVLAGEAEQVARWAAELRRSSRSATTPIVGFSREPAR